MKTVYIESSIPSYLTARPCRDVRATAWQQLTIQWWEEARSSYELYTSELVITEISGGDPGAATRRLEAMADIAELKIDKEVQKLAEQLILDRGIPSSAQADALHIAVAAVHQTDYLLTWNCRHIDNAASKPIVRSICAVLGPYSLKSVVKNKKIHAAISKSF